VANKDINLLLSCEVSGIFLVNPVNMKKIFMISLFWMILAETSLSQVGINTDGSQPDPTSMLDVRSENKGLLIPRMTMAQRDSIAAPANGLIVICTDCDSAGLVNIYLDGFWKAFMLFPCNPPAPAPGNHIPSASQIIWNWKEVSGAKGYKWSTTNNFSTAIDMGNSTSKTETGLTCNTPYTRFVWAYGNCGASLAAPLNQTTSPCWVCGQSFTDFRDGKTYNTVLIGTQCWMKQNLNVGSLISGTVTQTNNGVIEKYCYENKEDSCTVYGGLYQWDEYMNYTPQSSSNPSGRQGICPSGWHIPSDAEWLQLVNFLGGNGVAGGKMKEAGTSHWKSPNYGATNSSGFTALPAGTRDIDGTFDDKNLGAFLMSATEAEYTPPVSVWCQYLVYTVEYALRYDFNKSYGMSGRCIKD
jgi:uncharacterized protein (TIGR02145 family)